MRALLVGPTQGGGEGVYLDSLRSAPPRGVRYEYAGGFHQGAEGAPCALLREVLLNRLVHPRTIPDVGIRALRLREPFDLVHAHAHPVWLAGLGATPLVLSEGSSSAVYLLDYLGWDRARLERAYKRTRRVYRAVGIHDRLLATEQAARVYVFSRWARGVNVEWGADPERIEVVYPGFPTPEPARSQDQQLFTFLFIGSDFERKGGFDVVEAFAAVVADHPEARLVIVAPDPAQRNPDRLVHSWVGPERRKRLLGRMRVLERRGLITRHGPLPRQALTERIYPNADAFVMPTIAEGFGFTNVEAMSFGLPVISSRTGPIEELVTDQRTGLLVDAQDVGGVAAAMSRLLADRAAARRLGAAGRQDFLARFTLERFRSELGRLYRAALEA